MAITEADNAGSGWLDPAPMGTLLDDESALVIAAIADRRAFAPLDDRNFDPVYRYCWRRRGGAEAADATALVFAKALAALGRYRGQAFRPWLFAIAHNVVVDRYRGRDRLPDAPIELAVGHPSGEPSLEDQALAAEQGRELRQILAQLPSGQRAVVELRLAGLSGAEIAALGKTRGAVDAAQFRSVPRLRRLLASPSDPDQGAADA